MNFQGFSFLFRKLLHNGDVGSCLCSYIHTNLSIHTHTDIHTHTHESKSAPNSRVWPIGMETGSLCSTKTAPCPCRWDWSEKSMKSLRRGVFGRASGGTHLQSLCLGNTFSALALLHHSIYFPRYA